ncbi:MAG: PaaI family thioesterase [Gammaproteobacteria bacterium]
MSETEPRTDANNCFVCGPQNPIGLNIKFEYKNGECHGQFTPQANHVGFDGVTHGGIIFSVLDDLMANWLYLQGGRGFTAKSEIRYREPLPVGKTVKLVCELKLKKRKLLQLHSRAVRADTHSIVAESEGTFMISELGAIEI